ncbi:hypothetical protein GALMADRAFT_901336 [Galerina marginata CBS 339.88]|uniref:NAD-dependent epimerase/dehydratase domain-containing protein n=1 Tax=Galerina marginata (strain CBS 339.88) TaxID=685588 RepID=A0A067STE2_GALM3|nr:hypothetical protein GALMADRAFT_901336 [Galerina marginata CBS 339.88]
MPIVDPNESVKVLVTGANGFIGMWVVRTLLEQGYTVRGAVRSEEKGKRLREYFGSYSDRVEWTIVEDIVMEGAFDEAVKEVDAIEHVASPLDSPTSDPDGYIKPAVQGTIGILQSALKFGTKVKRIVLTSSATAMANMGAKPGVVFDETTWGDEAIQTVKDQGKDASGVMKYWASKTLAEKAAWDFYSQHKNEIKWDIVTLNPPLVIGPPLQELKTPQDLNSSLGVWWRNITQEKPDDLLKMSYAYVDVRDVAAAHVLALRKEEAAEERIILSNAATTWQESRNILYVLLPKLYTTGILPRGKPELEKFIRFDFNPEKGKRILGLKYRSFEEMASDTLADFEARDWLEKPVDSRG